MYKIINNYNGTHKESKMGVDEYSSDDQKQRISSLFQWTYFLDIDHNQMP